MKEQRINSNNNKNNRRNFRRRKKNAAIQTTYHRTVGGMLNSLSSNIWKPFFLSRFPKQKHEKKKKTIAFKTFETFFVSIKCIKYYLSENLSYDIFIWAWVLNIFTYIYIYIYATHSHFLIYDYFHNLALAAMYESSV